MHETKRKDHAKIILLSILLRFFSIHNMNKQEQVILLAKFTLLLIQLNPLKPRHKEAQNWKKFTVTAFAA